MIIQSPSNLSNTTEVTTNKSALVSLQQRGDAYCISSITGTIAAALAANASVFAMRLSPTSTKVAYIERVRIQFTSIVAFTVPITAGRRLAIFRGAGASTSGGTSLPTMVKKNTTTANLSNFDVVNSGDVRISTTGALTVTGITFEAEPISTMTLVHCGAAGAFYETVFELSATESAPLVLNAGQLLAIRSPRAMDAAGTWQMGIRVDWYEENTDTL